MAAASVARTNSIARLRSGCRYMDAVSVVTTRSPSLEVGQSREALPKDGGIRAQSYPRAAPSHGRGGWIDWPEPPHDAREDPPEETTCPSQPPSSTPKCWTRPSV